MVLAGGLYVPNAPNLIDPAVFGGAGTRTFEALRGVDLVGRWKPDTLVVVTPHWVGRSEFLVQGSERPPQLYDFSGFPPALSSVVYRPAGDPALARALVDGGTAAGLPVRLTDDWGLDHGAWAPLVSLVPGATVPVVPASIARLPPSDHLRWGRAIGTALRAVGTRVVLIGTGSILHRLDRLVPSPGEPWREGEAVEREALDLAVGADAPALAAFDRKKWALLAPEGDLGPLFVVLGAVGRPSSARLVSREQVFGSAGLAIVEYNVD